MILHDIELSQDGAAVESAVLAPVPVEQRVGVLLDRELNMGCMLFEVRAVVVLARVNQLRVWARYEDSAGAQKVGRINVVRRSKVDGVMVSRIVEPSYAAWTGGWWRGLLAQLERRGAVHAEYAQRIDVMGMDRRAAKAYGDPLTYARRELRRALKILEGAQSAAEHAPLDKQAAVQRFLGLAQALADLWQSNYNAASGVAP